MNNNNNNYQQTVNDYVSNWFSYDKEKVKQMNLPELFDEKIYSLRMTFAGFMAYTMFVEQITLTEKKVCETPLMNDFDDILMSLLIKINDINEILYYNKRGRQTAMGAGCSDRVETIFFEKVIKYFGEKPMKTINEDCQKSHIVLTLLMSNKTATFYNSLCTDDDEDIYQTIFELLYYYTMSLIMFKHETDYMFLGRIG